MYKSDLDTPALIVDLDVLECNIQATAVLATRLGVGVIPHAKAHKVVEIARAQVEAGAEGVAIAKIGEGEAMAAGGIRKLMLTTPPAGPGKVKRLRALAQSTEFSVVVDSLAAARFLSDAVKNDSVSIGVFIEVDTGLGRCGLPPGAPVVTLAEEIAQIPGLVFKGLKTAALQVYNQTTPEGIARVEGAAVDSVLGTSAAIRSVGIDVPMLVIGSTPSVRCGAIPPGITHVQPGSYVFNSLDGLATGAVTHDDCALTVLATIVSRPAPDRAVADAGFKALTLVTVPQIPGYGQVVGMPHIVIDRLYEEHAVLRCTPEDRLQVGDRIEIIPNSCSAITNQFDHLMALRKGSVEAVWSIQARGKYT